MQLDAEKVKKRVNVKIKAPSIAYASNELLQYWLSSVREEAKIETEVKLSTKQASVSGLEAQPSRDIYALGILMWELIFRRKAWDGMSLSAVFEQVVVKQNRPPLQANDSYELACKSYGQ